jgi:hypothetical protein
LLSRGVFRLCPHQHALVERISLSVEVVKTAAVVNDFVCPIDSFSPWQLGRHDILNEFGTVAISRHRAFYLQRFGDIDHYNMVYKTVLFCFEE